MPIGFYAISRSDLKELWAFQNEIYPLYKVASTEHDINKLIKGLNEVLPAIVEQEIRAQMAHRREMKEKHGSKS